MYFNVYNVLFYCSRRGTHISKKGMIIMIILHLEYFMKEICKWSKCTFLSSIYVSYNKSPSFNNSILNLVNFFVRNYLQPYNNFRRPTNTFSRYGYPLSSLLWLWLWQARSHFIFVTLHYTICHGTAKAKRTHINYHLLICMVQQFFHDNFAQ